LKEFPEVLIYASSGPSPPGISLNELREGERGKEVKSVPTESLLASEICFKKD